MMDSTPRRGVPASVGGRSSTFFFVSNRKKSFGFFGGDLFCYVFFQKVLVFVDI